MPQTPSIPKFRRQLIDILTEDLAAALSALREALPETAEKHAQVVALQARLKDANKERIRNTLSPDDYQRRIDTIRAECLDLINGLEEADFAPPAAAGNAAAKDSKARHGSVLYRVPHRMPLRKPSICTIRVAIDEDAILQDIVLDDNVRLRGRVEVSDMMRAELLDPEGEVFSIRPLNETEQLVRAEGYTQWLFSVTPRVEGEHQLLVKVSMMEYNAQLGRYVPRDVSVLETVTIVTETATLGDSGDTPLKSTGEQLSLGPSPVQVPPSTVARSSSGALRVLAFFLIFLLSGSSATWAFTPAPTRDWWVTRYIKDNEQACQKYIDTYKNQGVPRVEDAYFHKAELNPSLSNLRDYQRAYPEGKDEYRMEVLQKIQTLELKAVESLRAQPDAAAILRFVKDFPESERLPELRQAAADRPDLLPVVEQAYVASIQAQPSAVKVAAFLRDFPQSERLDEVNAAAAARPKVLQTVQPNLEDAYLSRLEPAPTAPQAEAFLQRFPAPVRRERFENILAQKPALARQFLPRLERAAAEQKAREEEERLRREQEAAEKARLEELQRKARETKDAAERERLEREAAEAAERLRQEEEARRDTDGDGVSDRSDRCPDKAGAAALQGCPDADGDGIADADDKCPVEKGDAAYNGCPAPDPPKGERSGLEMVPVQGGTFMIGCLEGRDDACLGDEKPAHKVTLPGFQIGKYEVTQADWRSVIGDNPSSFNGCDDCPVESVSWDEVQAFLKKLNAKYPGKNYRLSTEAEWEYAARGGHKMPRELSQMTLYVGSNDLGKVAWYGSNSGDKTHPVGGKAANALGLYDMSGNVREWCSDWYGDYPSTAQENPKGPKSGSYRVRRGGGWDNDPQNCRAAYRYRNAPTSRGSALGFRLACSSF